MPTEMQLKICICNIKIVLFQKFKSYNLIKNLYFYLLLNDKICFLIPHSF